jgi:hypothetical protein
MEKSKMQSEPQSLPFANLLNDIEKGTVKVPQFQRQFVWPKQKSAELLDSILKGYPIGTFILWKTRETLRSVRDIGGAKLPVTPEGDSTEYVLDGQQRLTSLFAAIKGLTIERDNSQDNFADIYLDLNSNDDGTIVIIDAGERSPGDVIRVVDLVGGTLKSLFKYPEKHHQRLSDLKSRISAYTFSTILVKDATIDVATEIFTRINVTAKPLSVFEIMVAKTFDSERDFDLAEKYKALKEKLGEVEYDTVTDAAVLQTISCLIAKDCDKKTILKLDKKQFVDMWPVAVDAIERAVDYFRAFFRIPVSALLPYGALIVPFAYFFYRHKDKPLGEMHKRLQDFFWRVSLTGRYSYSLESRIAQDLKRIDLILDGEPANYDQPVDLSPEFILENGVFNAGRSYIKALLCVLTHAQPKSFADNAQVTISNDWLKQANSRNYHHFFPKAYLKKVIGDDWRINHIANITIVDDFLNKRVIRDKAPSKYMAQFSRHNDELDATMQTHLINMNKSGVWENDFDKFLRARCIRFSKELKKRIIPQPVDNLQQSLGEDMSDETPITE